MARISELSTEKLESILNNNEHECQGDLDTCITCKYVAAIERELDTRDYDESDPWSPQNHHD